MADKNIESAYKLSPMQQGMLFHTVLDPTSGVYFTQLRSVIQGSLNVSTFKQAWQRVMERHAVLRTAFFWEELEQPLQVVYRQVRLPWEELDWRAVPADEQTARLDALLQADRERGFKLTKAPLMRCTLIRLAGDSYSFVWSIHHLLIDGWCLPLIFKELFAFYHALSQGQDLRLRPARPYRDYIAWLQRQDLSAAERFWRETLAGFSVPTPLTWPAPGVEAAHAGEPYAEWISSLPATTTAALQNLAQHHQLTLNTIVQGAWALLLHRYSGEHDIVFGATVSGRPADLAGSEHMIGLFINTLPVRIQVAPQAIVVPWLKDLQAQQVEQRQYEYSPLVQVQGWSDVPRGTPLFESIVVFENYPMEEIDREQASPISVQTLSFIEQTHYPLTLMVTPGAMLSLKLFYDAQRFGRQTIERIFEHLHTLLAGIAANPGQRLVDLQMLGAVERQRLLVEWNDTQRAYPQQGIHELVAAQAMRTPSAIALVHAHQHMSYHELNQQADQLAHYLQTQGVGPDVRVGVCLERSARLVVALLGVLKAGGAYVPLDPAYPQERLQFMLHDAQVAVLLTQESLVARLLANATGQTAQVVCLDTDWSTIAQSSIDQPASGVAPDNLAYVIYTSGSTGVPKGVAITHRGLSHYLHWAVAAYGVAQGQGSPVHSPLGFDLTVTSLFAPLLCGRSVWLLPETDHVAALAEGLSAHADYSLVKLTPAHLDLLRQVLSPGALAAQTRAFVIGGEALRYATIDFWRTYAPGTRLINEYGPTETVVGCCSYEVSPSDAAEGMVPIGRPIANMRMYLLDAQGQLVPIGAPGELYIGGVQLARGYLNRPDLTAERFVPDPFSSQPGARLYRTGDLARYTPDGTLIFLGRIDQQVKLRGYRIELGEIETTLRQHPAVDDVAVIVRNDQRDRQLVAYIVANNEQRTENMDSTEDCSLLAVRCSPQELRAYLRRRLPDYMLPSAFVFLPALPLTPNGKLDRKSLPEPDALRPDLEKPFVAPQSADQARLAQIWAEVLKIDRVGAHDSFFELGGHSLIALQMLGKIRDAFSIPITLRQFFAAPTVAQLAEVIAGLRQPGAEPAQEIMAEDLASEIALDPTIRADGLADPNLAMPAALLLTGATGFLGPFLLHDLLTQTQADIYCLVRATTLEQGRQKLQAHLTRYSLWEPAYAARLIPVIGDLSRPLLGLTQQQFQTLAQHVDVIYHNGALVNFVYPYSVLKGPNVLGTHEVLRLAALEKLKPVHFVSTNGVFYSQAYAQADIVYEADPIVSSAGLHNGYAQSKWVAEQLLLVARSRDMPVAIYRPGRIGWHSSTGAWNNNDLLYKLIKGCLELGSAPDFDYQVEITPVDFVSQAIVRLSQRPESLGQAFHLVNPSRVPWNTLVEWIRAAGGPVERRASTDWLEELKAATSDSQHNSVQPLLAISAEHAFQGGGAMRATPLHFDIQQTRAGLAAAALCYPRIDERLVQPLVWSLRAEPHVNT